jgi:hypothetical protein
MYHYLTELPAAGRQDCFPMASLARPFKFLPSCTILKRLFALSTIVLGKFILITMQSGTFETFADRNDFDVDEFLSLSINIGLYMFYWQERYLKQHNF